MGPHANVIHEQAKDDIGTSGITLGLIQSLCCIGTQGAETERSLILFPYILGSA
jgi:hypothetical protein